MARHQAVRGLEPGELEGATVPAGIAPALATGVVPAIPPDVSRDVPPAVAPRPPQAGGLRVAFLVYRGNPRCGGQGVYTRHLTRELVALGHSVEVFAGQPWPVLDEGVGFTPVPSLDLYREPDPFRLPRPSEIGSWVDLVELGIMCTAGFPEPRTFSIRARRLLRSRLGDFDIVHDNQCLGSGLLGMIRDGWPLLTTLHHPITVDRQLALSHAGNPWKRVTTRRWFGFLGMQARVSRRLPRIVTVSESSRHDIADQMGVDPARMTVVPVGVDHDVFRPRPLVRRVSGRIMVTSSSDVPMKGIVPLLEAVAKLVAERSVEVVVIGRPQPGGRVSRAIDDLGLGNVVRCVSGVSDDELACLYAEAEVAVVPSLYEGFSLPAIEAMACGVPVVATTGGALPEVVGTNGETGVLVPPNDPDALACGIRSVLDDPGFAARLGTDGRRRVLSLYTWRETARRTAEEYRELLASAPARAPRAVAATLPSTAATVTSAGATAVAGTPGAPARAAYSADPPC
ncbi:MAG: glycosyltransferase family 4 protein [Actinomycetota bacterium]|nr:glycosyltransferase family 4 protein [Actinomycetota bacterium]